MFVLMQNRNLANTATLVPLFAVCGVLLGAAPATGQGDGFWGASATAMVSMISDFQ